MIKRILATSGGFLAHPEFGSYRPGGLMNTALQLSGKERPKVTFVMTASGDDSQYLSLMYNAMSGYSCDINHLALFPMPNDDPAAVLGHSDVIWVGGGSVVNLLALWKAHGVDHLMREAWERGAVLAGVSAGSICWHLGGPTDSYGKKLQLAQGGLGLLPYGNGVHYDNEEQRRPLLHDLVRTGSLPLSFATDDRIGILYENTEPIRVIADRECDGETGPAAYRVELVGAEVVETRLPIGDIKP